MVELLPTVDAWCSYMGWTLLALGLLSCLFARTFKLGVLVMVLGNIPLILGIAAPRRVMEWVINQGVAPSQFPTVEQSHTLGIASGLVVFLLLFLIYWYPLGGRKGPAYYFWQNKTKRLSDDDPIMGDDGLLDSERSSKNNNKRGKNKARTSTLHLKSGDNPLSLKDTSKAHDELTQLDADREPTLSSDLFTKRGPRRAAARAMAHTKQGSNASVPNAATNAAANAAAPNVRPSAPGRAQPAAHAQAEVRTPQQGSGADTPPPSLGSFLSRLDAMTSGAGASADLKPRSAIPDAVIPGGMDLVTEPHVGAGVSSGVSVSGQKVGDLLHDLSADEAGRRSAEAELKARMQAENTPHQGGMSFSDILSSASSRQSKLEASQDGFAPDNDVVPPESDLAAESRAAAAAHGLTVRPSARKFQEPTPVDEALQEQGALADDEIELSRRSSLSAAEAASLAKTKLYSPGRTVGQALAELDQAIPAEAEVISSEQPPRLDEPSDEDLITALSAADVEIVKTAEISEHALNEAAAAHAQDVAPERVQHIKSLEAELEAKEAALKAREAALEAQQAALKAKEVMLSLDKNESAESKAEPNKAEFSQPEPGTVESSKAAPSSSEPSKAEPIVPEPVEPAKPRAAAPEMPSASYSFTLKAPHQEKHTKAHKLPQFMGDSTSYSFELDFKTNAYGKSASKADAPTKQFKVEATFSAEDETKQVTRPYTEPEGAKAEGGQELQANFEALKAQAQAECRALSEQREQKDKEAKRQRDEMIWQRAERVAHELLSEAKSLGDEVNAPTTAAQMAARAGITPNPAKDPKAQHGGHLPYALTADYTDAGQDEARSLAALLKGDSDLALTVEKVKAQTDAAMIAQGISRSEGIKSLGGKASAQRFSLQEDSAEVERMFEQITRVLQENSENQLNTTPAAAVAPLKPELKRDELHLTPESAFKAEPAVVGELKVHVPEEQTLKIEPAAKLESVAKPAAKLEPATKPKSKPVAKARSAKDDGISDNTVITRTKPSRAPETAAKPAKTARAPETAKTAAPSRAQTKTVTTKAAAASTAPAPAPKAAAASTAPAQAPAPEDPATKVSRTPRPAAKATPTKAGAQAQTAPAPQKLSAPKAAARPAATSELPAETSVKTTAPGRSASAARQAPATPSGVRKAAVAAPAAEASAPTKSLASKSTAAKPRTLHKSTVDVPAAAEVKSAPPAKTPGTVQAGKTASAAPDQPQAPSAPVTKPRHSLKTKRRSAGAELKEEAPAAQTTAPAAPVAAPASEAAPAAAPKRRATLKSHSLKRVRPQAPARASGE